MSAIHRVAAALALLASALLAAPTHAQPAAAAPDAPATAAAAWSQEQLQAVHDALRHSSGTAGFEYKWVFYTDERRARVALLSSMQDVPVRHAAHLVDLPPVLRPALINLYVAGQKAGPLPYTSKGTQGWVVVQLVRRLSASPLPNVAAAGAARPWVQLGWLPAPEVLLADPQERARVLYWNATTPEAIAAIARQHSPNVRFGNFYTPLTLAIANKRRAVAEALLARGADLRPCSPAGCPLGIAASMNDPEEALEWVRWLLARGAPVDGIDPDYFLARDTALAAAVMRGHRAAAEALRGAGASLDGVPQVRFTPIEAAASQRQREMVEWLIDHGASVLPVRGRGGAAPGKSSNLYLAAASTGDQAFAAWARKTMLDTAARAPQMRYDAYIEQDRQRIELKDGARIALRAAPFQLVLVLRPGEAGGVTVGASLDPAWLEEVRRGEARNPLFRPFSAAALAEPPAAGADELFVGRPCAEQTKADAPCPGVQWHLQTDARSRRDFDEVRTGQHEYVRHYRSIADVSGLTDNKAQPLQQFAGRTLYLALGVPLSFGGQGEREELVGARLVQIDLKK